MNITTDSPLPHVKVSKVTARDPNIPGILASTHWLKGHLLAPVKIGERMVVSRYERAAKTPDEPAVVECAGHFETSPVVSIDNDYVITENSVWRVEKLPPR